MNENPLDVGDAATLEALDANLSPEHSTAVPAPSQPSTFQTASALFNRETIAGAATQRIRTWWDESQAEDTSDFDPYAYVADNPDEFGDVMGFIRKEGIEDVGSADRLHARADGWRRELSNQRSLATGTTAGHILGTGLSFADVSTLVPVVGIAGKAGMAVKIARGAGAGFAFTAGQEAALQGLESTRTARESYMNIGVGTALGGGLGLFGHMVSPTTVARMNVRNPEGQTEYHGGTEGLRDATVTKPITPEQARGEAPIPDDQVTAGASGQLASVGAAARTAPSRLDSPRTAIGRQVRKAGEFISSANPNMRALYYKNDTARRLLIPMSGTPVHTTEAAQGIGVRNVDQAKDAINAHLADIGSFYTRRLNKLNEALGVSRSAGGYYLANQADTVANVIARASGRERTRSFNAVSQGEFTEAVRHKLLKFDDPDFRQDLIERHGAEPAAQLEGAAQEVADRIHRSNKIVEDKMVDAGVLKEDDRMGDNYGMAVLYDRQYVSQYPKQVKAFLRKKLSTDPDEDFLEAYGLDRSQFESLGEREVTISDASAEEGVRTISASEGAEIRDDLLADWSGTSKDRQLDQLEAEHEQAKASATRSKADALNAYHQLRTSTSGSRKAGLKLAREYARQGQRKLDRYKRFREGKANEKRQLVRAAAEARRKTQFRNFTPDRPDIYERGGRVVRSGREPRGFAPDLKTIGRIDELTYQIERADNRIDTLDRQIRQAEEKLATAEEAASRAKALEKESKRLRKELKDAARKAGTAERKAARRLRRAENAKDVNQVVDDIYDNLKLSPGDDAVAAPDHLMSETGRTKRRRIHWTTQERREGEKMGLIQSDLWQGLSRQYDELAGTLALREVYGNEAAGLSDTAFYQSLRDDLDNSYVDLIERARASGDKKAEVRWTRERKSATKDLENYIQYHLGRLGRPKDPDSKLYWASRQARKFNHSRYGLGFGLSSLPDISSAMLAVGGQIFNPKLIRRARENVNGLRTDEIAQIAKGSEMWLMNRSATFGQYNVDQAVSKDGIGIAGSRLNTITGNTSRYLDWSSRQVNVASGMAAWNSMGKVIAGLAQAKKLHDLVQDYDNIYAKAGFHQVEENGEQVWRHTDSKAALEIGQLSSLGIGAQEAKAIADRIRKFGVEVDDDGVVNFNFQKWFDEGNQADADAAHLVMGALQSAQGRAIPTPGAGDRPFLMSDPLWGTLLQFQTFGFVSVSKLLTPMAQRLAFYGDREAFLSAAMAASTGLLVTLAKDGGDEDERSTAQLAYDAFDRGGFLGFLSSYSSATMSLLGSEGGSRYQSVSTLGQLLGPTFGLAVDASTAAGAATQATFGDTPASDVWEKTRRLAPYQNLFRLSDAVIAGEHDQ